MRESWGAICRLAGVYVCKWAACMYAVDGECKLELVGEEGDNLVSDFRKSCRLLRRDW